MPAKPAIVLSCHNTGLGVIRSLGARGVPVVAVYYDDNDMGQVSRYCIERVKVPHPEHQPEAFVDSLVGLASRHGGGMLFPCDDETLTAVSQNHAVLSGQYFIACGSADVVRKVVQKQHTYRIARQAGVPHPRTLLVQDAGRIDPAFVRGIGFPCLVKPCESHRYARRFAKKLAKVWTLEQLDRECAVALAEGFLVMIQEFIPGPESQNINYNSYAVDSGVVVDFTAEKVRLCPPESGVPCVVRSRELPDVRLPAARMLEALGYSGYSCMEFKLDARDGVYKLLEVNGRYNRSIALSLRCGVNFPFLDYEYVTYGRIPRGEAVRPGVYWIDMTKDLFSWGSYVRSGNVRLRDLLAPYRGPHVFSDFTIEDVRPFLRRVFTLGLRGLRSLVHLSGSAGGNSR